MKRYEGALRRLSILFILINLLSPLSAATTTAQDQTTDPAQTTQAAVGTLRIILEGPSGNIPGGAFQVGDTYAVDGGQNDADGIWDGVTTVANLPAGDYVVTQAATGDGYVASTTVYTGSVPADSVGDLRIWNDLVPPPDTDGDSIINANDSCPDTFNVGSDWNGNGVDDACDPIPDSDGDGLLDNVDSCPLITNLGTDWNNNGIDDACDPMPDRDADGVEDSVDNCPDAANPAQEDTDQDGTGDACETVEIVDIDLDGIADDVDNCPSVANADQADSDGDKIGDACDEQAPVDSDSDGLTDDEETKIGTDPKVADTDADGLNDGDEVNLHKTDPLVADSDGDGVNDGDEIKAGTDPLVDETATPVDTDSDGLTDEEEAKLGTDPKVADTDGDGLSDGDEVKATTDPLKADTDGDGMNDGDEIAAGRDPLKAEEAALTVAQTVAPETASVDDVVTFTITITNSGQLAVENIAIANSLKGLSDLTCAPADLASLAPEGSITCTATYNVTKQDEKTGSVTNTATVTSDTAKVDPVAATVTVGAQVQARSITTLAAAAAVTVDFAAYTPGTYDPSITSDSPSGGTVESLTPGGFVQCGSYLYYQALVTAASSGDFTFGYIFDSQSGTGWTLTYSAPVRIEIFSQSGSGTVQLVDNGDGTYTLTGLEDGDVVEILMVTELLCLGTNPVTGQVNVSVQFDAQGIGKQTVPLKGRGEDLQAALGITKSGPATVQPGGNVTYTITVYNTGNAAASNVVVMDDLPAGVTWSTDKGSIASNVLTYTIPSLAAEGSETITITGTVPVDGSVCSLSNVARIEQGDNDILSNEVGTTVNCQTNVSITKTGPASVEPGGTVTYTITVTNNGTINATNILVTDNLPSGIAWSTDKGTITDGALSYSILTLAPQGSEVITVTGDVPLDGSVCAFTNTASFSFSGGSGTSSPAVVTTVNCIESATADKSSTVNDGDDDVLNAGDRIEYSITVTNTGTVDLVDYPVSDLLTRDGVDISGSFVWDPAFAGTVAIPVGGAPVVLTGYYVITQADLNDGVTLENCVYLNAAAEPADCVTDTITGTPSATADKSSTVNDGDDDVLNAGDRIEYSITVTNTGTVDLVDYPVSDLLTRDGVDISGSFVWDPAFAGTVSIPVGGAPVVLTGYYVITQADLNDGVTLENCVYLNAAAEPADCVTDTITGTPSATADKSSTVNDGDDDVLNAGDRIEYSITVTNTGTVDLVDYPVSDLLTRDGVDISGSFVWDPAFAGTVSIPVGGAPVVLTGYYVITQADLNDGVTLENCVYLNAAAEPADCVTDTITGTPSATADKSSTVNDGDDDVLNAGDRIEYSITVTNTGTVDLVDYPVSDLLTRDGVDISGSFVWDPAFAGTVSIPVGGAPVVLTGYYVITQADLNDGVTLENCVYLNAAAEPADCVTDTITGTPSATADKSSTVNDGDDDVLNAGDRIEYSITVTNTGTVDLVDYPVSDLLTRDGVDISGSFVWDPAFAGTVSIPARRRPRRPHRLLRHHPGRPQRRRHPRELRLSQRGRRTRRLCHRHH